MHTYNRSKPIGSNGLFGKGGADGDVRLSVDLHAEIDDIAKNCYIPSFD